MFLLNIFKGKKLDNGLFQAETCSLLTYWTYEHVVVSKWL
jgi:hypothetical protein